MSEESNNNNDTTEPTTSTFAVAITPEFDEQGNWSGMVSAHIEEDVHNDLGEDDLLQIRSVCGMMASTLTLMAEDPEFLDYVREFFMENYKMMIDQFIEDYSEDSPQFTRSADGKVITLNFNTKTHGSA